MNGQLPISLPWFFVEQSFRTAGWPKRAGFLQQSYVPQFMLAMTLDQMAEIAVALGAGSPECALGVLASLFGDRDWQRQPAQDIFSAFDASGPVQAAMDRVAPWTAIADGLGWRANADVLTSEISASMKTGKRLTVRRSVLQARRFQFSLAALFTPA